MGTILCMQKGMHSVVHSLCIRFYRIYPITQGLPSSFCVTFLDETRIKLIERFEPPLYKWLNPNIVLFIKRQAICCTFKIKSEQFKFLITPALLTFWRSGFHPFIIFRMSIALASVIKQKLLEVVNIVGMPQTREQACHPTHPLST